MWTFSRDSFEGIVTRALIPGQGLAQTTQPGASRLHLLDLWLVLMDCSLHEFAENEKPSRLSIPHASGKDGDPVAP